MRGLPNALITQASWRVWMRGLIACLATFTGAAHADPFTFIQSLSTGTPSQTDGTAVAVSGDWMLVGGSGEPNAQPGVVEVYQRNARDQWDHVTQITSPNAENYDQFGSAVAFDGDTVVIGAPGATVNGNTNAGRAYVFKRTLLCPPPTFTCSFVFPNVAELIPALSGANNDGFGFSVAIKGDIAAVGVPYVDRKVKSGKITVTYTDAGLVDVYQRNSGGTELWGRTAEVFGDLDNGDHFGYSVALGNGLLLIGAPYARVTPAGTTYHSGRAYFFNVDSSGLATSGYYVGTVTPADARNFGWSVAIDDSIAAIGAPSAAGGYQASVDIFKPDSGGIYRYIAQCNSPNANTDPNGQFGSAVAVSGTQVMIGARTETGFSGSDLNAGNLYLFDHGSGNAADTWFTIENFFATGPQYNFAYFGALLGFSVAFDGLTAVGGAPGAAYNSYSNSGAAVVFSHDLIFRDSFGN